MFLLLEGSLQDTLNAKFQGSIWSCNTVSLVALDPEQRQGSANTAMSETREILL